LGRELNNKMYKYYKKLFMLEECVSLLSCGKGKLGGNLLHCGFCGRETYPEQKSKGRV